MPSIDLHNILVRKIIWMTNIRFSGQEMFNSCIDSIYIGIDDGEDDRDITIEEIREIILKRVSESIKLINKFLGE